MQKSRLGRGLEALFGDTVENEKVQELSVDDIYPNPYQPRIDKETDISDLVRSIKKHGVLQPILVVKKDEKYEIVAGERRWIAARKAGFKKIPAIVGDWNETERMIIAMVENLQRKNLSPLEEGLFYSKLKQAGMSQEEIADLVGKSRAHVANIMRTVRLPSDIKDALADGRITLGHAKAILSLDSEEDMLFVFSKIIADNLTVRQTEDLVRSIKSGHSEFDDLEKRLSREFDARVSIKKGKDGKLRITIIGSENMLKILEGLLDSK